jgi:hypothetical protein
VEAARGAVVVEELLGDGVALAVQLLGRIPRDVVVKVGVRGSSIGSEVSRATRPRGSRQVDDHYTGVAAAAKRSPFVHPEARCVIRSEIGNTNGHRARAGARLI